MSHVTTGRGAGMRAWWAKEENRQRVISAVIAVTPNAWTVHEDERLQNLKSSGLSDREIAKKLERSHDAVRTRLKRLRGRAQQSGQSA